MAQYRTYEGRTNKHRVRNSTQGSETENSTYGTGGKRTVLMAQGYLLYYIRRNVLTAQKLGHFLRPRTSQST